MTDADLIAAHDREAQNTMVGTSYYVDELDRRSRERATDAANRLANRSFWLAVSSTILSAVATVAAVLALIIR
ncbi:hypothetical protein QSU92_01175 [Microbacterium sp. ET2]|uniref:hypothetical protein n=1 Tax=Microbacterium albipurpureum TaxID=3050384 RepID=UPI00259D0ACE|nr:hypothetical protein [Microbacterium sp. ET2 (Ac-2212)]WJL95868.1 hypothetical protein QSU92_01175 [Microbacterium sp. ET2 (Ac-2212)]